jgi:hypothetical protein
MTNHRVCNKSNTTGAICGGGTDNPSGASEFILGFSRIRVTRSLVFCVVFCRSLFVIYHFPKGLDCDYDKKNIYVVICDTDTT